MTETVHTLVTYRAEACTLACAAEFNEFELQRSPDVRLLIQQRLKVLENQLMDLWEGQFQQP